MLKRLSAAQKRWPDGMPYRLYKLKKRKDYGSNQPVEPLISRTWKSIKLQMADRDNRIEAILTLGVCGVIALCLLTFYAILPTAIDGLIDHQRQVVAESRK